MFFQATPLKNITIPEFCSDKKNVLIRDNTLDEYILDEIFKNNQYEIKSRDILKYKHLSHFEPFFPRVIFDLGANIGLSTIYFAAKYPDAMIYSIEPDVENFYLLEQNTNDLNNGERLYGAIWGKNETLYIANRDHIITRTGKYNKASYYVQPQKVSNENPVNGYTIQHLMEKYMIKHIDVCKIDIQGAEKEIFSDNTEWLNDVKCVFVEVHDRFVDGCFYAVSRAMEKHEFVYISSSGRDGNVHFFVKKEKE